MSETRYKEIYEQGTGRLIGIEAYTVSDAELQRERDNQFLQSLLETSPEAITMPQIWKALRILIRRTLSP